MSSPALTVVPAQASMRAGVSREEYDALPGAHFSGLKELERSPKSYQHAKSTPREDTDAMSLGRAIHALVFEPKEYSARVAIWCGGRRAGKEWEAFRAANAGKDILKEEEADEASAIARAITVKLDSSCIVLAGGMAEPTLEWRDDSGYRLKGRPDWVGAKAIIDLKTTKDAGPRAFGVDCASRHYHAQAALYSDGVFAATGKRPPFYIVAAEKSAPCDVVLYEVQAHVLSAGRELYRRWLALLKECERLNRWPGYDGDMGPVPLSMPTWSVPVFEEVSP